MVSNMKIVNMLRLSYENPSITPASRTVTMTRKVHWAVARTTLIPTVVQTLRAKASLANCDETTPRSKEKSIMKLNEYFLTNSSSSCAIVGKQLQLCR
mmetsp:Transcript_5039/g.12194  ORF Transcript_5039/g.12194 Transcript_5039/m.12194 type:complete len:98 (+) Transcript_5039:197-490(+)